MCHPRGWKVTWFPTVTCAFSGPRARGTNIVCHSIPSLGRCTCNDRTGGLGAFGYHWWNCLTRSEVCFIPEAGIHVFSDSGYPFHLTRYRVPRRLDVGQESTTFSTS